MYRVRSVNEDRVITVPPKGAVTTSVGSIVDVVRSLATIGRGSTRKDKRNVELKPLVVLDKVPIHPTSFSL